MKVIILEDEPLAVRNILSVIEKHFQDFSVIGVAQSNAEARELLQQLVPDLLLCDIHLADGLSFEVLQEARITCPTIFITAYDKYALQSFDHNCIDYVLKPINNEKLKNGLERARESYLHKNGKSVTPAMLQELLKNTQLKEYKKRFICKVGAKVIFKNVEEIAYFFVDSKITFIQEASTGKKFMVNHNLEELEQQHLNPTKFYRINRSTIINLDHLVEMKKYNNGRLKVLTGSNDKLDLIVARDRVSDFKDWINQ